MPDTPPSIVPILKKIPLFAELEEGTHKEIIKRIKMELYPVGYVLSREGDFGDKMYIIKSGMMKVARKDAVEGVDLEVATLGPNDFFGEMALISEEPRNATVTAVSEVELFVLQKSDFLKLVSGLPEMARKISDEFIMRIKANAKNQL